MLPFHLEVLPTPFRRGEALLSCLDETLCLLVLLVDRPSQDNLPCREGEERTRRTSC